MINHFIQLTMLQATSVGSPLSIIVMTCNFTKYSIVAMPMPSYFESVERESLATAKIIQDQVYYMPNYMLLPTVKGVLLLYAMTIIILNRLHTEMYFQPTSTPSKETLARSSIQLS